MAKAYYHHMDSLRAVMMVLGVVLHAAQVFDPPGDWLIANGETHIFYEHLEETIHIFRMPVFFMVSGFFTLFVLLRKGPGYFASSKLQRIGVPILTIALTLNLLQSIFLDYWNGRPFSLRDFLLVGWVGHLWFLVNLLIYFMTIYLLSPIFSKYHAGMSRVLDKVAAAVPALLVVLLLPLANIFILALNKIGFPLYWSFGEIISISSLLGYLVYFSFGIAMYLSPVLADRIQSISLALLAVLIALTYAATNFGWLEGTNSLVFVTLREYVESLRVWSASILVYVCFYRFFAQPSAFLRLISESSYTVYLVHHSLIIFLGALLVQQPLNLHLKFLLLFVGTYGISYLFHRHVVAKNNLASYLLNGRALKSAE